MKQRYYLVYQCLRCQRLVDERGEVHDAKEPDIRFAGVTLCGACDDDAE